MQVERSVVTDNVVSAGATARVDGMSGESVRFTDFKDARIALRPDKAGDLDDVVVRDVSMFRAERMDDDRWWICCYLGDDGDRIAWDITGDASIFMDITELPEQDVTYEHGSITEVR